MSVTQAQIAQHLGVDQRTVSIALGARGRISDRTRKRVLQTARDMGYRPNRLAAGLRGARTYSIGMIWLFADPWMGDVAVALRVLQHYQQHGFVVYQAQTPDDHGLLCRQLDDMLTRRVDAIVIQGSPGQLTDPPVLDRLRAAPAVVAVAPEPLPDFPGDLVVHDRFDAIRAVVDHFAKTGRRRPAMLTEMAQEYNPPKFRVFAERCREHGIDHDRMLVDLGAPPTPEMQGQLHRDVLRRLGPASSLGLDALFCFSDVGALYVMRDLQAQGVRVPEDVAIVGFNDIEPGRVWLPPLATGDRCRPQVADAIQRLLDTRIADASLPPRREVVPMRFVWRESAG